MALGLGPISSNPLGALAAPLQQPVFLLFGVVTEASTAIAGAVLTPSLVAATNPAALVGRVQ